MLNVQDAELNIKYAKQRTEDYIVKGVGIMLVNKPKIIELKHRDVVKLDGMYFSVNTKTKQMTHIAEEEIEESRTWA